MNGAAVEVEGLTRVFGDFVAVDGASFRVEPGESFGIDRQGLTLVQACRDSKLILAQGDAATPAPPTALNAVELQQWARTQRSLVIADALSSALAALHNAAARVLARAFAAPGSRRPGFI